MAEPGYYFISYSSVDAKAAARQLADKLEGEPPNIPIWLDQRKLRPGDDWDEQIVEAIKACRGVLFVMTPDSVKANSVCKNEWVSALRYKKPVIPLRLHPDAELPFRLGSRQFIDFTGSLDAALARLRSHLDWRDSPAGRLQGLKERLADAERELPRADQDQEPRIEQELGELRRQIAEQERVLADPKAATQRTQERIASALEREREPEERPAVGRRAKFINPPPLLAPTWFQDRHTETGEIGKFLKDDGLRLMTVVGRGGVGKTAMVCRLLKALEGGQLPDDGGPLAVDGIVYLSPVGAHKVNYPNLFADLTRLLPDDAAKRLERLYQDPQQSPKDQMLALLEAFPDGRTVVLLDNFEDVVDATIEPFTVSDAALDEGLRTVLTAPQHGVKVILTTRVAPGALLRVQPAHQRRLNLDEGLGSPFAENILKEMDPDGTLGLKSALPELLAAARERTGGFPRALEALVAILNADRDTSLPELLAETASLPGDVVQELVGEAFNRLDPLAQQVMQALAVYGLPVPPVAVDYLLQPFLVAINSAPVLGRLVNMQFVRRDAGRYYLHQVDRDYALSRIPKGQPDDRDAIEARFTRYGLRQRGAEYFAQTRTPRTTWKQLDDLAPQLAEFELRCQGEDYDTAVSVLLEIDFDYLLLWGHYALIVELHQRLQGKVTDPDLEQASTGNLGTALDSMGRYREAIARHEEALALARLRENPWGESTWLGGLGNSYFGLGEVRRAIGYHEQALTIARAISDRQAEEVHLGNLASCYYSLGDLRRAIGLHEQALVIDREIGYRQGEANELGSLGGCYASLGDLRRAIGLHEQALAIYRGVGDRQGEASQLGSLGSCYAGLGDLRRAIGLHEQALAIDREVGDRQGEAIDLTNLGDCDATRDLWEPAIQRYREAIRIADETGAVQSQSEARSALATAHLLQGELAAARQAAEAAQTLDYPINNANVAALSGVILLRQGEREPARAAFPQAVAQAEALLAHTSENYAALDTKALALGGLVLLGEVARLPEAIAAVQAARAVNRAAGVVRDAARLWDALAVADEAGTLASVRAVLQDALRP
jgi:tetratricopeptide (TPR) repeat protein